MDLRGRAGLTPPFGHPSPATTDGEGPVARACWSGRPEGAREHSRGASAVSPDIKFDPRRLGVKFDPSCGDDVCPRHKVVSPRAQVQGYNPMSGDTALTPG